MAPVYTYSKPDNGSVPFTARTGPVFTPEEEAFTSRFLSIADPDDQRIVLGPIGTLLMARSWLSPAILRAIWNMADEDDKGYLTRTELGIALRLISHAQFGRPVDEQHMNIAAVPPEIRGFSQTAIETSPGPSDQRQSDRKVNRSQQRRDRAPDAPLSPHHVKISAESRADVARVFIACNPEDGLLDAGVNKEVFLSSGLSAESLYRIWDLVDTQYRGALDLTEFTLGMFFIQSVIDNTPATLPLTVPAELYTQASGGRLPSSPEFLRPWDITSEEKAATDRLLSVWDPAGRGYLHRATVLMVIRDVALENRLPDAESISARIWSLVDCEESGRVDVDGFAVAMHLINEYVRGKEPPAFFLPLSLLPPSWRRRINGAPENPFKVLLADEQAAKRAAESDRTRRSKLERAAAIDQLAQDFEARLWADARSRSAQWAREDAERQARSRAARDSEEAARSLREEKARRARMEAEQRARTEERRTREESERRSRAETERRAREEAERKARETKERTARHERDAREEKERRAREDRERRSRDQEAKEREENSRREQRQREDFDRRGRAERDAQEDRRAEQERDAREERRAEVALERNKHKDYYGVLGVEKDCDDTTIKTAYRRESLKHHPDKGGDPDRFKLIQEAREILSDPKWRRRYDSLRAR